MSLLKSKTKPELIEAIAETPWQLLKLECALHLQPFSTHWAGGGSYYIFAGDTKIRIANHSNTSKYRDQPDLNIVSESEDVSPEKDFNDWAKCLRTYDDGTGENIDGLLAMIDYPETVKKTIFAKHVGLTVPKLKKLLTSDCYDEICENEAYPNTLTEVVICELALERLTDAGITKRVPFHFGTSSMEDWNG